MAPRLTALRRARPGRVTLEVDGRPWRLVPDEVVVRCGLTADLELERPLLREIRRALRRAEARELATPARGRRDLSRLRLDERLAARGVGEQEREGALATLARAGVVDDTRLARSRAATLAERGWGDAAVLARLATEGIPAELARDAVSGLTPESERARAVVASVGDRRKAWARLARRGFSQEATENALGALDEEG
jgi:SOS response regulatory protein OraA/RecX